jgi:thiamine biosynthesis lipoprotein
MALVGRQTIGGVRYEPRSGSTRTCGVTALGVACLTLAVLCGGCAAPPPPLPLYTESALIDGIAVRVTVRDTDEALARRALTAALDAARQMASRVLIQHEGSEIDVLVRVPSHVWIELSRSSGGTLLQALAVAEATDGAYDPTAPPLLKLWGLRPGDEPRAPRPFEVETILRRVDWNDIEVERDATDQARRLSRRTEIDLGAQARGAMLDAALGSLRSSRVAAGRASTMGEHAVFGGTKSQPWSIQLLIRAGGGIAGTQARAGTIDLYEGGVAIASRGPTSTTPDGTRVHDRFDSRTGYPANDTLWLAIQSDGASYAAGWADAVFALGDEGAGFVKRDPRLQAVIQPDDGELLVSPGLRYSPPGR